MKKKALIALILIVCVVLCTTVVVSACVPGEPFVIDDNRIVGLTNYGRKLDNITIPDGITSISYQAFSKSAMRSLYIPSSVTDIGIQAFIYCKNLTTITVAEDNPTYSSDGNCIIEKETNKVIAGCKGSVIPNYATGISKYAFYKCAGLTSIKIPASVTDIGEYAFAECSSLTSIDLPENVTNISEYVFYKCKSLTNIDIPEGVTEIGKYAFAECSALTGIEIPETLTSIGSDAFGSCLCLTSIDLPLSVTQIEDEAFWGCSSLVIRYQGTTKPDGWGSSDYDGGIFASDDIAVPVIFDSNINNVADDGYIYTLCENGLFYALKDGVAILKGHGRVEGDIVIDSAVEYNGLTYQVKEIGRSAFRNYKNFDSVVIPQGVTKIGECAFACCGITSAQLPNSLEEIGEGAFGLCTKLTSVNIPDDVYITEYAFAFCVKLTVYIPASVEYIEEGAFWAVEKIFCQATEKPDGWDCDWYTDEYLIQDITTVEWGYSPN